MNIINSILLGSAAGLLAMGGARAAEPVEYVWDESHVDVPDLDLVLPHNAAGLDVGAYDIAAQASAAWEAAVCWDDAYAVKRLAEVRAV